MSELQTATERQRNRRKRLRESGGIAVTIEIPGELVPKLDAHRGVDSRNAVVGRIVERALRRVKS